MRLIDTATAALSAIVAAVWLGAFALSSPTWATDKAFITVASTTSTQNSGLFRHILPRFTEVSGIEVRVVAVGTGAAIRNARAGDADVLLVHHKPSEDRFVANGYGVKRHPLMYNDFVIVGPHADPADIAGGKDAATALGALARVEATFISRGDASGTHRRERELWETAGLDPTSASGTWYRETGSGMGATLNIAAAIGGHTLADRGTWLSFVNRRDLRVLVEGDPALRNEYGVILVSGEKHPHVKTRDGQTFIDWLLSRDGRAAINSFMIDGQQLFIAPE